MVYKISSFSSIALYTFLPSNHRIRSSHLPDIVLVSSWSDNISRMSHRMPTLLDILQSAFWTVGLPTVHFQRTDHKLLLLIELFQFQQEFLRMHRFDLCAAPSSSSPWAYRIERLPFSRFQPLWSQECTRTGYNHLFERLLAPCNIRSMIAAALSVLIQNPKISTVISIFHHRHMTFNAYTISEASNHVVSNSSSHVCTVFHQWHMFYEQLHLFCLWPIFINTCPLCFTSESRMEPANHQIRSDIFFSLLCLF